MKSTNKTDLNQKHIVMPGGIPLYISLAFRRRPTQTVIALVFLVLFYKSYIYDNGLPTHANRPVVFCPNRFYERVGAHDIPSSFCTAVCSSFSQKVCSPLGLLGGICTCLLPRDPAPVFDVDESRGKSDVFTCGQGYKYGARGNEEVKNRWCEDVCASEGTKKQCLAETCECKPVCPTGMTPRIHVNFNNRELGEEYTTKKATADFGHEFEKGSRNWSTISFVPGYGNGGSAMRVTYQKGCVGFRCTLRFMFAIQPKPKNEVYLSFKFRLSPNWQWILGGKFPGSLCGGKCPLGNGHPTGYDGWTSSMMWRENGVATNYLYYLGQTHDVIGRGENQIWKEHVIPGEWHRVVTRVKMNVVGFSDGILQTWLDGEKVVDRRDIAWRLVDSIGVDNFLLTTFFGGMSPEWAPLDTVWADYDDYVLCAD